MPKEFLCQNCLRVITVEESAFQIEGFSPACDCGGEGCACPSCTSVITLLRSGIRDPLLLGLVHDKEFEWSEHSGISL